MYAKWHSAKSLLFSVVTNHFACVKQLSRYLENQVTLPKVHYTPKIKLKAMSVSGQNATAADAKNSQKYVTSNSKASVKTLLYTEQGIG